MWWCISRGTAFAITSGTIERDRLADSSMGACKSKRAMSVVEGRRQQSRTSLNAPMIGQGNGGATRALVVGAYRTSGLRDWKKRSPPAPPYIGATSGPLQRLFTSSLRREERESLPHAPSFRATQGLRPPGCEPGAAPPDTAALPAKASATSPQGQSSSPIAGGPPSSRRRSDRPSYLEGPSRRQEARQKFPITRFASRRSLRSCRARFQRTLRRWT